MIGKQCAVNGNAIKPNVEKVREHIRDRDKHGAVNGMIALAHDVGGVEGCGVPISMSGLLSAQLNLFNEDWDAAERFLDSFERDVEKGFDKAEEQIKEWMSGGGAPPYYTDRGEEE